MKAWVAEDQAQMASKTANHDVSRPSPPDDNPLVVDEPTFWMSRATERIADQKFFFFHFVALRLFADNTERSLRGWRSDGVTKAF
jgi:hypothetical protein